MLEVIVVIVVLTDIIAGGIWGMRKFHNHIYKICPACKKTIDRDSNFCKFCGEETPNAKLER